MFYIKNIKINNFRCFKSCDFSFDPKINILIGNNGCGKTTVVEAISYLCLGKSFKNAKDADVLRFNQPYFNVIANLDGENEEKLVISYDGKQKKIKKDEYVYKTLSEHVGIYKLISFCPDDLDIIKGTPSIRRNFLDVFISQYDITYLKMLVQYKKVLKTRNEFLKNVENDRYDRILFGVINEKLVQTGLEIIKLRNNYISLLNEYAKSVSKQLLNDGKYIEIKYLSDVAEDEFKKTVKNCEKHDLMCKTTSHGPHRDDFTVSFGGVDASSYSSQGQIRIAVLALKLAIYQMFSKQNNNIIIILDDVFSELDINRQSFLMEYIKNVGQVFITTTEISKLPSDIKENSKIIEIKEGETNVWYEWKH